MTAIKAIQGEGSLHGVKERTLQYARDVSIPLQQVSIEHFYRWREAQINLRAACMHVLGAHLEPSASDRGTFARSRGGDQETPGMARLGNIMCVWVPVPMTDSAERPTDAEPRARDTMRCYILTSCTNPGS